MSYRQWVEVTDRVHRPGSETVVLLLVQDVSAAGWYVRGYDQNGRQTTETWHGGLPLARRWAESQYTADAIGTWREIPDETTDPIRYALRRRR